MPVTQTGRPVMVPVQYVRNPQNPSEVMMVAQTQPRQQSKEERLQEIANNRFANTVETARVVKKSSGFMKPFIKALFVASAASTAFVVSRQAVYNGLIKKVQEPIKNGLIATIKETRKAFKAVRNELPKDSKIRNYADSLARTCKKFFTDKKSLKALKEASKNGHGATRQGVDEALKNALKKPVDNVTRPIEYLAGAASAASITKVAIKGDPEDTIKELQHLGDELDGEVDGKIMGTIPLK